MSKGKLRTKRFSAIMLVVLIIFLIALVLILANIWKENHRFVYSNAKYGLQVTLPYDIQSYIKKEYEWPSHEKAYNGLESIAIATSKEHFTFSGNYYLSHENPAQSGDVLNIEIYDISLCKDRKTDDAEKVFCQKFVNNKQTSGTSDYVNNPGYWVRGNKFLYFFLESPDYYTNIRSYNKDPDPIILNSYTHIPKKFKIIITD